MSIRFNSLRNGLPATLLMAVIASTPLHAADAGGMAPFPASGPDYRYTPSVFSDVGTRARQLVDYTTQSLQVFNQRLAHSISTSTLRMTPADLPSPDNWDYEYWDYVKEPKSFVMPTTEGGVMFEFQFKY
ncbi:MAG TPA: hypothetical protein ENN42_05605 [Thioalkalivibrio sp.]|nr:hypothetical protein [Thioalkalivibrio sp.]